MKTLHKLMFGCLALMVALSMAFVSCSDDDDDDGGTPVVAVYDSEALSNVGDENNARVIAYSDGTFKIGTWWGDNGTNYKGLSGTYTQGEDKAITLTPTGRPKKGDGITFTGTDANFAGSSWEAAPCYTASANKKTIAIANYESITSAEWEKIENFEAYAYLDAIAVLAKAGDAVAEFTAPVANDLGNTAPTYSAKTVGNGGVLLLVVCKAPFGKLEDGEVTYKVTGGGTIATASAKTTVGHAYVTNQVTTADGVSKVDISNTTFGAVKFTAPEAVPDGGIKIEATYVNKANGATATGEITLTKAE